MLCAGCWRPLTGEPPACPACDSAQPPSDAQAKQRLKLWVRLSCAAGVAALVGLVVFIIHSGPPEGRADAAAALAPPIVAVAPPERMVPLVRTANECFSELEAKAKAAGNDVSTTGLVAMFTLKPAAPATITTARKRLKDLDARLLDYDAAIRKTAAELAAKVESADAPPQVKANVMAAVRESGTDLVKRCRESIAHQRQLVQHTQTIVAFIEPRLKRLSTKSAQTAFTNKADQAAFEKLAKQYDALEDESNTILRRIHQRSDQAKQQLLVALTQPHDK
jgi:hypothetical protein